MNKLLVLCFLLCMSCNTIDIEKLVKPDVNTDTPETSAALLPEGATLPEGANGIIVVPVEGEAPPPEIIIIEKPVYVPEGTEVPPAKIPEGRAAVEAANRGIVQPKDYENAAMLYDYHRDFVYELYCRPLRVSDVTLQAGEKAEPPFISDSERWMIGGGVSYENGVSVQHIYVKPTEANLEATLIINTSVRVYHLILRSFPNVHMPIVRWRYPDTVMPQNYAGNGFAPPAKPDAPGDQVSAGDSEMFIDPRFLSFNYTITHGVFRKPRWFPTLAYDDGKKTYITFPDEALQTEMPAVFEERAAIINYRVMRNVIVIDKLIQKVTVKLGNAEVIVEKKKGNAK